MNKHRIILVDDHEILREGLKSLIQKERDFTIVAEACDGEALLEILTHTKCELILLDISMPGMDGISVLKEIKKVYPKIKVLILTMQKDHEHFKHAMTNGAIGYILKDEAFEQLVLGMKVALKGRRFVSPSVAVLETERFVRSLDDTEFPALDILSKREIEILKLVANGFSNKNIAVELGISIRTVETHRNNFSNKLGIKNTANLVKYALSKGLV